MEADKTTQQLQDSSFSRPQSDQVPQESLTTPEPETKKNKNLIILAILSFLFLTTLFLTGFFAFKNYQPKRQTAQTQSTPKLSSELATSLPTPTPIEAYYEPDFWYAIEVKQKIDAPTPAYYDYAYLRKPITGVLGLQDYELIEKIVVDTRKTKWGTVNFNGNYYIFVSKVNLSEKHYEDNSLSVDVNKLSEQNLIPYLVDNNYCKQDSDCTVRNAYYCSYGAYNYFEPLKDHVSGCGGETFDDELQQSVDTLCHKLLYQNPSCRNNECTAKQRVYEPVACD